MRNKVEYITKNKKAHNSPIFLFSAKKLNAHYFCTQRNSELYN